MALDIQSAIVQLILSSSSITSLITDQRGNIRFRPITNATIDYLPTVTYSINGTETFDTFSGNASVLKCHFQFDIFAGTYAQAQQISFAIRTILHNYQGTIEDCRVSLAKHKEDYDNSEPPDIGQEQSIIRLASNYLILYRPSFGY